MNRELARKLLFIVNDKNIMSELDDYIQHRIEFHRNGLENDIDEAAHHRGAISELRRFKFLRDEVHRDAI